MIKKLCFFLLILIPYSLVGQQSISGKILDPSGNPIPDVAVKIKNLSLQTVSDAAGEFKIFAPTGKIIAFKKKGYKGKQFTIKEKHQSPVIIKLSKKVKKANFLLVQGKVIDFEKEEPLIGATILVKGTDRGIVTDIEGNFEMEVPKGTRLEISFMCEFCSKEFTIEQAGYQEFIIGQADEFPLKFGNQTTIKQKDFNQGNIHHPIQLIQAKVPGLMSSMGGGNNPFGTFNFRLRGLSSFNGEVFNNLQVTTAQPLIVLDGIPEADITLLDPLSITSMTIIKDGTAAQYGIRGASGVIEISTDPAKHKGIQYHTFLGIDRPHPTMEMLDAKRYKVTRNSNDLGHSTDWYQEVTRTSLSQVHQLVLNNTIKNTHYSISANFRDANGILKYQGYDRLQFGATLRQYALDNRIQLSAKVRNTSQNNNYSEPAAIRYAQTYNPTAPIFEEGNEYDGFFQTRLFDYYNPVAILEQQEHKGEQNCLFAYLSAQLDLLPTLSLATSYGNTSEDFQTARYISKNSLWRSGTWRNGFASQNKFSANNQFFDAHTQFSPNLLGIQARIKVGYQEQTFKQKQFSADGRDFLTDAFSYNNLGAAGDFQNGLGNINSTQSKHQLLAYYANAQINWKKLLLINMGWRIENSSRLGSASGLGNFPYIGVGVDLGQLSVKFLQLNKVKFRSSYGITGNLPYDNYLSQQRYSQGYPSFYVDGEYIAPYVVQYQENPNLKWEEKKEWNIGLNIEPKLFGKTIQVTADLYQSKITDIIRSNLINEYDRNYFGNIGGLKNTGFEAKIAGSFFEKTKLSWHTSLALSTNKTILTNYSDDPNFRVQKKRPARPSNAGCCKANVIQLREGDEIGDIWLLKYEGISSDGQWIFADTDGDGIKDDTKDEIKAGNGLPNWLIGWNNTIAFGHFDVNLFFRGAVGHKLLNVTRKLTENPVQISAYNVLSSTFEGESARLRDQPQESTYYLENASFLRLDNLRFSYTFPLRKNSFLHNLQVYAAAQNVWTISGYTGWDTDYRMQSLNDVFAAGYEFRSEYLPTKSFVFGLKVGM